MAAGALPSDLAVNQAALAEVERIISIPVTYLMTEEEQEEFNRSYVLGDAYARGFRLNILQTSAVREYIQTGGLVGPIGVGCGKTLITLLIAHVAYLRGKSKTILFVPSSLCEQLLNTDIPKARKTIVFSPPVYALSGTPGKRRTVACSGLPGLYVFPYSILSKEDAPELLRAIAPNLVIMDEAHSLPRRETAKRRRAMKMLEEFDPELVILSGTLTRKSPEDYYHLMRHALGRYTPLPLAVAPAMDWASVLHSESDDGNLNPGSVGPIMKIVEWARTHFPEDLSMAENDIRGFRRAYMYRMVTVPGVVASGGDNSIGTSIRFAHSPIAVEEADPNWIYLTDLMSRVENEWITPNGDVLPHHLLIWKWLYELTAGFYNDLKWPTPRDIIEARGVSDAEAESTLARSQTYHELHTQYQKTLRSWLRESGRDGLDTPMLVGHSLALRGASEVGVPLHRDWLERNQADFEGRVERYSTPKAVCDFRIKALVEWVKSLDSTEGVLVWYFHRYMGVWAEWALAKEGISCVRCPAGSAANKFLADADTPRQGASKHLVLASLKAHSAGKNLQGFHLTYFLDWPRPADMAEQALGRNHRQGQTADELTYVVRNTTEFDDRNYAATLVDALYSHQINRSPQKLILGTHLPLPKIMPPNVLREKGFECAALDPANLEEFYRRFGK